MGFPEDGLLDPINGAVTAFMSGKSAKGKLQWMESVRSGTKHKGSTVHGMKGAFAFAAKKGVPGAAEMKAKMASVIAKGNPYILAFEVAFNAVVCNLMRFWD